MTSYASNKNPARSAIGFAIVAALHALLIWALIYGLGHKMIDAFRGPTLAHVTIDKIKPQTLPLAPPPASVVPVPQIFFPQPHIIIDQAPSPDALNGPTTPTMPAPQPFKPAPVPVVPDTNVSPSAITGALPAYPDSLQDQDVTGSATVKCDVEADGSTSNCAIIGVTGSRLFGSAVLAFVKSHKLHPATHNGAAVRTPGAIIPYKFTLTD